MSTNTQSIQFFRALYSADFRLLEQLIVHTPNWQSLQNPAGLSPLCYAFKLYTKSTARYKCIELLLINGAELNNSRIDGEHPIHYVIKHKPCLQLLNLLLSHKVDITVRDEDGYSSLDNTADTLFSSKLLDIDSAKQIIFLLLEHGIKPGARSSNEPNFYEYLADQCLVSNPVMAKQATELYNFMLLATTNKPNCPN